MKQIYVTNIDIITGLPGSGKTTLAKKMYEKITKKGKECIMISLDNYRKSSLEDAIKQEMSNYYRYSSCYNFIIEGLMLTNDSIITALNALNSYVKIRDDIQVNIHYFNEDRESCLHNDIGRREKDAKITIQNAKYEIPDAKYITKETGFTCRLQKHTVIRKSNYDIFRNINGIVAKDELRSASWSLGGTYGTCYRDTLYNISPDSPKAFTEFDNLLEKICPNITFLQYKKLENECTQIVEYGESDYYGGREYRAYHKCNLHKLYDLLNEMGYINIEKQIEEELNEER